MTAYYCLFLSLFILQISNQFLPILSLYANRLNYAMVRLSYLRCLDCIAICYFCKNLCFSSSRAYRRQRRWVALFCSAFLLSFLFILKSPLGLPTAQSRTEHGESFLFRSLIESPNATLDWRMEATLFQSIEESTVLSNETWIIRSFKRLFCANELCLNPFIGMLIFDSRFYLVSISFTLLT